jgi:hypothetical protein
LYSILHNVQKKAIVTMKTSAAIIFTSLVGPASAFVAPAAQASRTAIYAAKTTEEPKEVVYSTAIPFLERPTMLDGTMAGDVGFDPLNFAKGPGELNNFREAEIKHSRLAML